MAYDSVDDQNNLVNGHSSDNLIDKKSHHEISYKNINSYKKNQIALETDNKHIDIKNNKNNISACEYENLHEKKFLELKREIIFLSSFFAIFFIMLTALFFVFRSIWIPVLIGIFLANLVQPVIIKFQKITNLSTPTSSLVILSSVLLVMLFFVLILYTPFVNQAVEIIDILKQTYNTVSMHWKPVLLNIVEYINSLNLPIEIDLSLFQSFFSADQITQALQNTFGAIWSTVPGVISFSITLIMVPLSLFFWVLHSKKIQTYVKNLIPDNYVTSVDNVFIRLHSCLKSFLVGQVYVALAMGLCYMIGYTIIGIKGSIFIGIAAGIGKLIPMMDMVTAFILSSAVILSSDGAVFSQIISSVIIIIIVSILDAAVLTPKLIGSSAGLSPIIVFSSLIAFSTLMGFWGVVLAIPIVIVSKELALIVIEYYMQWQKYVHHKK